LHYYWGMHFFRSFPAWLDSGIEAAVAAPEEEARDGQDGEPDEDLGAVLDDEEDEAKDGAGGVAVAGDGGVVEAGGDGWVG